MYTHISQPQKYEYRQTDSWENKLSAEINKDNNDPPKPTQAQTFIYTHVP